MVDVNHDDDETESFDLTIRVPGVAFDVGQAGFPRVLVVQKLADSVTEYDASRGDDEKGQAEYLKNALVRTRPDDAVYQCVFLPDSPVGRSELNDPKTRYPVPESRLIPLRAERASPIDNGPTWSPREAVQLDVLKDLFDTARAFSDGPDLQDLHQLVVHSAVPVDVVEAAREHVEAGDYDNVPDDMSMSKVTPLDVDDGDGPDMELTEPDDEADGESEDDPGDPPEVPSEDGEELGDFGDFDGDEN